MLGVPKNFFSTKDGKGLMSALVSAVVAQSCRTSAPRPGQPWDRLTFSFHFPELTCEEPRVKCACRTGRHRSRWRTGVRFAFGVSTAAKGSSVKRTVLRAYGQIPSTAKKLTLIIYEN